MLTIQQLEFTTPNHRHRPSTIKLLAAVTVDISVSMGSSETQQFNCAWSVTMVWCCGFKLLDC
jgi:hypothetical protein